MAGDLRCIYYCGPSVVCVSKPGTLSEVIVHDIVATPGLQFSKGPQCGGEEDREALPKLLKKDLALPSACLRLWLFAFRRSSLA
jgi:hypothetical protein